MSPNLKILIVIGFSVGTNLVLMLLLSKLPGMHIPHGWWLAGVAIPVLISSPVAFVLVRQSESIRRLNAELTSAYQVVKRVSETDHLTGVPNRASFDMRVASLQVRRPGWFLVVDIDHFKDINDRHGHALGDAALRIVAEGLVAAVGPMISSVASAARSSPSSCPSPAARPRWRLPRTSAKRWRTLVITGPDGARIALTASIGVSGGPGHTVRHWADRCRPGDVPRQAGRPRPRAARRLSRSNVTFRRCPATPASRGDHRCHWPIMH